MCNPEFWFSPEFGIFTHYYEYPEKKSFVKRTEDIKATQIIHNN
jgi:hypothetical protein